MENKVNQNVAGLNLDSVNWQIKDGLVTYALNANVQGHDGESLTYTNEPSNQVCYDFEADKPGFQVVGTLPILEQEKLVVFLAHPDGRSEIGVVENLNADCQKVNVISEKECDCPNGSIIESKVVTDLTNAIIEEITCTKGYTYDSTIKKCVADQILYTDPISSTVSYTLTPRQDYVFGNKEAVLYDETFTIGGWAGDGTFNSGLTKLSAQFWRNTIPSGSLDGRVNQIGVTMGSGSRENFWFEFIVTLCVEEEKVYHLALAADNSFRFELDGVMILDPTNSAVTDILGDDNQWNINVNPPPVPEPEDNRISYERLHIYPIRLTPGNHFIKIGYVDYGVPQMLAAELYDNTAAEIIAATSINDLNVVWSTEGRLSLETVVGNTCPEGFELLAGESCEVGCYTIRNLEPQITQRNVGSCCKYTPIITDDCNTIDCEDAGFDINRCCLKLSVDYPVSSVYRIDECETQIFFIDKNNPPRKFTLEDPLGDDGCGNPIPCLEKVCSRLDLFPSYCHPTLHPIAVESGGRLKAGTYSFALSYTDDDGGEITDYHDLSNPIPIFERKITEQTEYETSQSIRVRIEHKEPQFTHFNLIVAENINETTTYHLIGTYKVSPNFVNEVVYTGDYKSTFSGIAPLIRTPHYDTAGIIEKQNDILMLADLKESPYYNFQPFANDIELQWQTVEMPSDGKFDYSNPEIAYFFRTYQRDEVYPFGIKFKLKNGKYTDVFHIPGISIDKVSNATETVTDTNKDFFVQDDDCIVDSAKYCDDRPNDVKPFRHVTSTSASRWLVYNTATKKGNVTEYLDQEYEYVEKQFNCKIYNHEYGDFAFWQSTECYPCDESKWGKLAGQPIRHHKFPDSLVSHIHDGLDDTKGFESESKIYPIGVTFKENIIADLLNEKDLVTGEYKYQVYDPVRNVSVPIRDLICAIELVRGNRVNNKSIIAKGLVYDVARYEDVDASGNVKSYYYPNYPYNQIGKDNTSGSQNSDPYLANRSSWYDQGNRGDSPSTSFRHIPFNYQLSSGQRLQNRFTFYSPDTTFQLPKIGTELKLETIEYGQVLGHFVPVEDHPEYKFMRYTQVAFLVGAISVAASYASKNISGVMVGAEISQDLSNLVAQTQLLYDITEKLIPFINFAYQYNSVAAYNNYSPIQNGGNKRRVLDIGRYIDSKISNVEDDSPVHNRLRESSVYLRTTDRFVHQTGPIVGEFYDNSRYTISEASDAVQYDPRIIEKRSTRAYYTSLKRTFLNQYGQIENIRYVSTGYTVELAEGKVQDQVQLKPKYYPAFGGDTFINKFALKRKHSFFTRNLANLPAKANDVPFDYWLFPNLAYPTYYIGTSPEEISFANPRIISLALTAATVIYLGANGAGLIPTGVGSSVIYSAFIATALNSLYILKEAKVNLDNENTALSFYRKGQFYTASYGIPIFFVESDVNVDFRHGRNDREENFYPNVSDEIPDEWLQETNVPIKFDNFYHYNATYSSQNISPNLPYNIDSPDSSCVVVHPNRVIYSEKASTTKYFSDGWQTFKRGNVYDFPKEGGKLINLTAGENELVYARFENTTKIYGARVQLESTSPVQLEVGDASMFKQKPVDISKSDLGYVGSQHKAQVRTEFGTFFVDAKRGHIYQISKQGFSEIKSETNFNWFKQNLPFKIIKYFPEVDIDNPAKGLGITMGWDERYERVFITKLDYIPVDKEQLRYDPVLKKFFVNNGLGLVIEAPFEDTDFWENHSWTIAYSPKLKNFISFYSFLPNYYVSLLGNFQTIVNYKKGASTWNHNLNPLTYQTYYNKLYPYILEYNVNTFPKTSITNSISLIQDIQEYQSDYEYYSIATANNKNLANFTKAIIYNKEQSSGVINLVPEEFGNTRQKILFPRTTLNGIETLISRRDNIYSFNGFWSITNQSSGHSVWSTKWDDRKLQHPIDKVPNTRTVVPSSIAYQKQRIKSDFCKVRLIQDKYSRYRFINHLQITQTN